MSEEAIRILEIGVAGVVVTMATFVLGLFRVELLGVVFSLTTLAGHSVILFLDHVESSTAAAGTTDPPA